MLSVILLKGKIMRVCVIVFCDIFICTYSKTFLWKIKATFFFIDLIRLCTGVLLNEHFEQVLPSLVWNLDLENKNQTFMITLLSRLLLQWSQPIYRPLYIFIIVDINECRRYPGRLCAHKCENTPGSYYCTCTMGFKLSTDGRSCEGMSVVCFCHLIWDTAYCYLAISIWF